MFYRKEIIERLKTDTILRLRVCLALGITEQSVLLALKRRSKTLLSILVVNELKEYTGLKEQALFEQPAKELNQ